MTPTTLKNCPTVNRPVVGSSPTHGAIAFIGYIPKSTKRIRNPFGTAFGTALFLKCSNARSQKPAGGLV